MKIVSQVIQIHVWYLYHSLNESSEQRKSSNRLLIGLNWSFERDLDLRQCEKRKFVAQEIRDTRFKNKYSQKCLLSQQKHYNDDCLQLKIYSVNRKVRRSIPVEFTLVDSMSEMIKFDRKSEFRIFTKISYASQSWHAPIMPYTSFFQKVSPLTFSEIERTRTLADQLFDNYVWFVSSRCAKIVMLVFVAYFVAYFVYSCVIY